MPVDFMLPNFPLVCLRPTFTRDPDLPIFRACLLHWVSHNTSTHQYHSGWLTKSGVNVHSIYLAALLLKYYLLSLFLRIWRREMNPGILLSWWALNYQFYYSMSHSHTEIELQNTVKTELYLTRNKRDINENIQILYAPHTENCNICILWNPSTFSLVSVE